MWLGAACILLASLALIFVGCIRGAIDARVIAVNAANLVTTALLLTLAIGYQEDYLLDFALLSTLLGFVSILVYTRFLRRWF
jgi:multisubunit Na+/H+ antiporter MnhF subunit